ncbi:hypothetical protein [Bradyrhizobium sp. 23AC]
MGWPLAVSAGLMDKSPSALFRALWALSAGHLLATFLVLLPFAFLLVLVEWQRPIQVGASLLVIGFGVYRLIARRHPRALARIPPTQLALWSFAVAIAHGAALMLVPIYLGLCQAFEFDAGHEAAGALMKTSLFKTSLFKTSLFKTSLGMAVLVSLVHVAAMVGAGGCLAWLVYRHLGLRFVSRSWFNLDAVWATSLVLVGAVALALNLASWR